MRVQLLHFSPLSQRFTLPPIALMASLALSPVPAETQVMGNSGGSETFTRAPLSGTAHQGVDVGSSFSPGFVSIMIVGGALARLSWNLEDPQEFRRFLDQNVFDITDIGDVYGDGLFLGAGLLGITATSRLSHHQGLTDFSSDLARSLVLSSSATWVLKLSVGRKRPNGGSHSFPSGHTSAAFSVAPIVAKHLGWKAAVPAYLLASFTGIARMEDRRHYLSDVLFGAAIGLAAGDAVAGGRSGSSLLEYVDIGLNSVGVSLKF